MCSHSWGDDSAVSRTPLSALVTADESIAGIAERVESLLIEIEPGQLSSRFAERARYFDLVHMADAGPFADVLVPELCANWQLAHPGHECS